MGEKREDKQKLQLFLGGWGELCDISTCCLWKASLVFCFYVDSHSKKSDWSALYDSDSLKAE